jgi:hypothetical protein
MKADVYLRRFLLVCGWVGLAFLPIGFVSLIFSVVCAQIWLTYGFLGSTLWGLLIWVSGSLGSQVALKQLKNNSEWLELAIAFYAALVFLLGGVHLVVPQTLFDGSLSWYSSFILGSGAQIMLWSSIRLWLSPRH